MPTRAHDRCIYFSSGIPKHSYSLSRDKGNAFSIGFGEYGDFHLIIIWDRDQATYQVTVNKPGLYLNNTTKIPEGQPILVPDDAIISPPTDQNPKGRQLLFKITNPEEALSLQAGTPHERYCLGELLRGKRIFKAKDARLNGDVILKFVDEKTAETLEIARFAKAAGVMPQVISPYIARILDVRRWSLPIDGNICYFICREYLSGESLDILILKRALERALEKGKIEPSTADGYLEDYAKNRIGLDEVANSLYPGEGKEKIWQEGKLECEEAIDIMLQVSKAIKHLHEKDKVHGNLDPSHIIVGEDRYTKIIGFTPSRSKEVPLTLSGEIPGSSPFSPPEFSGTLYDDIYTLGAIFQWAITGILVPKQGPIPDLPEVPKEIQDVVRRSLCLKPSDRPMAQGMVDAFEKALASLALGVSKNHLLIMSPELPSSLPGIEIGIIYEPKGECGGDFYDVIDLGRGRVGIAIGDSHGQGVKEAHSAGMVRAGLKLMAKNLQTPEAVLFNTNKLIRCPGRSIWATALYGILNRRHRKFQFARAAHSPLLFYHEGQCLLLEPSGLPLGMSSEFSCAEEVLDVKENDLLIIVTDGITEAENPQGEPFGILGLIEAVHEYGGKDLHAFLMGIDETLRHFLAGKKLQDDATLIAIRIVEEEESQYIFYPADF